MAYELSGEVQCNALPTIEEPERIRVIRLTRRQVWVMQRLDEGCELELMKLRNTKAKRVARTYFLRYPKAFEADGARVQERTVRPLIDEGFAVRVHYPHANMTWVYSAVRYYESRASAR